MQQRGVRTTRARGRRGTAARRGVGAARLALGEGGDDVAERREREINLDALLRALACRARLGLPLRAPVLALGPNE